MNDMGFRELWADGIVSDFRARRSGPMSQKNTLALVQARRDVQRDGQPRRVDTKSGPIGVYPDAGVDIGFEAWMAQA